MIKLLTFLISFSVYIFACIEHEIVIDTFADGSPQVVKRLCGETMLYERHYYRTGNIKLEKDYQWESQPFGIWFKFDESGAKNDSGNFIINDNENYFLEKPKNGSYTSTYKTGGIKIETHFIDGFINGKWVSYYENGKVKLDGDVENGKELESLKFYTEDGILHSSSVIIGPYQHIWLYSKEGKIKEEEIYTFGKRVYRKFHENGRIAYEEIREASFQKYSGVFFYENGLVKSSTSYADDMPNGQHISYYRSGDIKVKGKFHNYHKSGEWHWYYENFKIKQIINYGNLGIISGDFIEYYEDGQIKKKAIFEKGKLSGDYYEYHPDGTVKFYLSKEKGREKYSFQFNKIGFEDVELVLIKK